MHQWECIHFSIGRRRRNTVSDKSGKVDLEAGEALFINAGQSYRLVRSEKESSSFYIIEVAGEYLAAGDESLSE